MYNMVSTLRFLTRMMELSGSSQKTETTRPISDRGDLCRKLASPLLCRWLTKQTGRRLCCGQGWRWFHQSHHLELEPVASGDRWGRGRWGGRGRGSCSQSSCWRQREREGKIAWPILPPAPSPGSSATDSLWPHLLRSWLSGSRKMPSSVVASRAGGSSENGSENQQADD